VAPSINFKAASAKIYPYVTEIREVAVDFASPYIVLLFEGGIFYSYATLKWPSERH